MDYFRVNYVLRALIVPAGTHTVEFRFEPREVIWGDRLNLISSLLLLMGTGGAFYYARRKKPATDEPEN